MAAQAGALRPAAWVDVGYIVHQVYIQNKNLSFHVQELEVPTINVSMGC